jgi:YidC/Oxa1 family membrane protein insertase
MQEKMQKLQPELKKLREKYGDDFTAMQQAQQELYRRHGVNPFSTLGGCLLLFAQMPIFLGLYYALQESIFLRLAPFLWIRNLAAPDMLFSWVPWNLDLSQRIPVISDPSWHNFFLYLGPFFNLLPIIAVALMIVQQKMMTPPAADEQQEMQQKMMKYMMVVFGIMFYKVAAGLCMYFIASSLWGLAERKLLPKTKKTSTDSPSDSASDDSSGSQARTKPRSPKADDGNGWFQKVRARWDDVLKEAGKQHQARSDNAPERETKKKKKKKRDRNA